MKMEEPAINEKEDELRMSKRTAPTMESVAQKYTDLTHAYKDVMSRYGSYIGKGMIPVDEFAAASIYANPYIQNFRLQQNVTATAAMTKSGITEALQDPNNNEQRLRGAGWALSWSQPIYQAILEESRDIPCFKHYVTPIDASDEDMSKDAFRTEWAFVEDWVDRLNLVETGKTVMMQTKREGKASYMLRERIDTTKHTIDWVALQKLPSDWVKLTGLGSYGYIASFNMLVFLKLGWTVEQYPLFIRQAWQQLLSKGIVTVDERTKEYKFCADRFDASDRLSYVDEAGADRGTFGMMLEARGPLRSYMLWVELPPDLCFTFASDNSHVGAFPDTIGLFLKLQELADYGVLAGLIASTPLVAILTGQSEFVEGAQVGQNQTKLDPETAKDFEDSFNSMAPSNIKACFAPFKDMKLQNLSNTVSSSSVQSDATKDFVSQSGEGGLISITEKPSIAQVKAAEMIHASKYEYIWRQIEAALNCVIRSQIGCHFKWKLHIFGDIYTISDVKASCKEAVVAGMTFYLPKMLACDDMTLSEADGLSKAISSSGLYDRLKTLTQAQQGQPASAPNADGTEKKPGRKPDADPENDSTAASQDRGDDVTEVKDQH
jgi:hypothetical protein